MKRILVVDDDATILMTLSRYLRKQGYQVYSGASGAEGLALFQQESPDVIISDVMMPEMDGLEFCRRLRQQRGGELIPFIFLSAKGELDDRVHGYELGADDYITKPFEPRELLAKIEAQIERSRRTQAELLRMIQQSPPPPPPPAKKEEVKLPLTPAEERVFREVIRGATNKQIGETLYISPRTVQTHLTSILGKLNLENRSQLVRFAFEQGFTVGDPESPASDSH